MELSPLPPMPDPLHPSSSPPPLDAGPPGQRRLIAIAEIFLCSSLPTQTLLQSVMGQAGWHPLTASGAFSLPFIVTMSMADTVLLIVLMVLLTRAHGESVSGLWLGHRPV